MNYFKSISICLFFLLPFHNSFAQTQDVRFKLVSGSNGIVLGKITGITSDKHGAMWFTDQNNRCLTRYDGTTMTRFQYDPKNVNTPGGKYPECILADSAGFLWIGYYGLGIDRFDPETNTYTHFGHADDDPQSLSSDTISAILIDHLGNFWAGTDGGLDMFDAKSGKFTRYHHNPVDSFSLSHNKVRTLYEDKYGTLWVGTGLAWDLDNKGGLNRFNREHNNFKRYLHDPKDPNSLVDNKVRAILEDSRGNFWIGTRSNGIHLLDKKTGLIKRMAMNPDGTKGLIVPPITSPADHLTFIKEDARGFLWFGTLTSGLIRYDPITNTSKKYSGSSNNSSGFKDNSGWWFYESPDGGPIWVSTQEDNLYQGDIFSNTIPHDAADSLVVIHMVEDADSILWLGTTTGLARKNLKDGSVQRFMNDPQDPKSISNNIVLRVLKDSNGDLWLGTQAGLNKFDPATRTFKRFLHDPNNKGSLSNNNIQHLYEDKVQNLWITSYGGGLDRLDMRTEKFTHYIHDPADTSSISSNLTASLIQDNDKFIWVGTDGAGLNRLDPQTGKFSHYLPGMSSRYIYIDSKGTLLVATDFGVYRYNNSADNFSPLSDVIRELEKIVVYTFIEDNQQNLWLITGSGIYRVAQKDTSVMRFGPESGISPELLLGSLLKTKNGKLLFGTAYGFYAIDHNKLKIPTTVPKFFLKNLFVNGELIKAGSQILKKPIFETEEINLSYDQNVFSIAFNAIDYGDPGTKTIYYKLEGYDKDWRQLTFEDQVYYFGVPPGRYRFKIKASTSLNGLWVEKGISVTITPPWWNTIWSYCMYVALFGVSVFSAHRIQKDRLVKKEREKTHLRELEHAREIEKAYTALKSTQEQLIHSEKMASLGELTAGIAHEIQNPLNFVNNFSEVNSELIDELEKEVDKGNLQEIKGIAKSIRENEQKIVHHGKRADAIVKGMLQHSRSNSGVKEGTDINALADEYLRLAYHGLRAKDKSFNASLKTNFDPTVGNINVVPQDIARVVLNLITNACYAVLEKKKQLPGFDPTISVTTKKNGDKVLISVKDNGIGISQYVLTKIFQPFFTTKPTGEGTGLGLSMSYDIVKAHGGELKVETKDGEGSTFTIVLPSGIS